MTLAVVTDAALDTIGIYPVDEAQRAARQGFLWALPVVDVGCARWARAPAPGSDALCDAGQWSVGTLSGQRTPVSRPGPYRTPVGRAVLRQGPSSQSTRHRGRMSAHHE